MSQATVSESVVRVGSATPDARPAEPSRDSPTARGQQPTSPPAAVQGTVRLLVGHPCLMTGHALSAALAEAGVFAAVELAQSQETFHSALQRFEPDVVLLAGMSPRSHRELVDAAQRAGRAVVLVTPTVARADRDRMRNSQMSLVRPSAGQAQLLDTIQAAARGEFRVDPVLVPPPVAASTLRPREREVLWMTVEGFSLAEMAARLCLTPGTVEQIVRDAVLKLDAPERFSAAREARSRGWL